MVSDRQTFGERLKRHRERRGVTLAAISETTKIASPIFAGLERGDCSRWPAGLYGRAYVRAYAEAVGLNPEETVEDFATLFCSTTHPDSPERAPGRSRRGSGALRLSMAEEAGVAPPQMAWRIGCATVDLLLGSAVAWATHAVLDPGLAVTVASGLAYHAAGRIVTDEPVAAWLYRRMRTASAAEVQVSPAEDVAVGDAASTAA